jgi:hypothetical protein
MLTRHNKLTGINLRAINTVKSREWRVASGFLERFLSWD